MAVEIRESPFGPGRPFQQLFDGQGAIFATLICGYNYFNERCDQAMTAVVQALKEPEPDVLVAGPAFDAGRYGLACGAVCQSAQELAIPALTATGSMS